MSKDNPNPEWLEDEKFKEFLREYVEKDAYTPGQDENLRVFVTYNTLYRIYTATINTKANVRKLDKDLAEFDKALDNVEKGLNSFGNLMVEHDRINKTQLWEARIFFILIVVLGLVLIFSAYNVFN